MSLFGAIHTSGSGMRLFRTWLDAVSDNLANVNTVRRTDEEAFRARYVQAGAVDYQQAGQPGIGGGVEVTGVRFGNAQGRLVSDPGNPLADAQGLVRYPDIDMGDQMTQLISAQRGYQANIAVIERSKDAYEQAIRIGKS